MNDTKTPLHMGDWILYKDTGSLFHKKCKRFHNTYRNIHICELYGNKIQLACMIITAVNICRDALRQGTWAGCDLPNIEE